MLNRFQKSVLYVTLLFYSGMVLLPIFIMYLSSFRKSLDMFKNPLGFPNGLNLENYTKVLETPIFFTALGNSILITSTAVFFSLVLGTLAAYVLARYPFRIGKYLYYFFLVGLVAPLQLASLPLFLLMRNMGLLDNPLSLILTYTAWRLSFSILIMYGFFSSLPGELEDAGRIDGCGEWRLFFRVMLPLAKPGFIIAGVYNAIPIWNDFFFPLIFMRSERMSTLPLAVSRFFGEHGVQWGPLFAFLGLSVLPIIMLYMVLSKQFIKGMLGGVFR